MSDKIKDGGPAFPQNDALINRINNHDGMSLRDWFAGVAVHEMSSCEITKKNIAEAAYALADAMLAEREK